MIEAAPLFELNQATVQYPGVRAVDQVSVSLLPGEQVALVGPSGSGKTTLLRLLNGTMRPTDGEVRIHGRATSQLNAKELRNVRAQIGFVHQDLSLVPNLRVLQNVLTGRLGRLSLLASLRTMLLPSQAETCAVHDILNLVGIGEKLYQRTDRLSGGQQQRVAIARALYQQPDTLLADEPVSSVDPARAKDTVRLLTTISQDQGLTLCMSLHNLPLAQQYFPRLIGMRRGRVVFDRKTSEIDDQEFAELYKLSEEELLADGASP